MVSFALQCTLLKNIYTSIYIYIAAFVFLIYFMLEIFSLILKNRWKSLILILFCYDQL